MSPYFQRAKVDGPDGLVGLVQQVSSPHCVPFCVLPTAAVVKFFGCSNERNSYARLHPEMTPMQTNARLRLNITANQGN